MQRAMARVVPADFLTEDSMGVIKPNDLFLMKGQMVRVVYVRSTDQGLTTTVDHLITPPVLLVDYDIKTQKVTFERPGGTRETLSPVEVLSVV